MVAEQAMLIEALRVELEALRRQAGRDSSNSSLPPSTDGPAAKAKTKAARVPAGQQAPEGQPAASEGQSAAGEPGRGRPRRKQGGQPGHRGSGLVPVATPTIGSRSSRPAARAAAPAWPTRPEQSVPGCRCSTCRASPSRSPSIR